MRKLILLAILVLLVFMPRCEVAWLWECGLDSDCDDGNPCTKDRCNSEWEGPTTDNSLCGDDNRRYFCENFAVDDGTPCEMDEQTGVCEAGECRLDGETSDGGV